MGVSKMPKNCDLSKGREREKLCKNCGIIELLILLKRPYFYPNLKIVSIINFDGCVLETEKKWKNIVHVHN